MIRKLEKTDVDKVANLWLEANLTACDFIPEKYWKDHFNIVKEQLLQAEVYLYEDCESIDEDTREKDYGMIWKEI